MAHPQQQEFCLSVKNKFPEKFTNVSVFDLGSLDINGNNRFLFDGDYDYVGVDLIEGNNVDIVCNGHLYSREEPFDTAISTECFEHDIYWKESFQNMFNLLKPGGLLLFTCGSAGRGPHGTLECRPEDSPATNEYYGNRMPEDYITSFNLDEMFTEYKFDINWFCNDLYFYGIKK
jgi:SAM-dependent methyltransferase